MSNLDNMISFVERPDSELYSIKVKIGAYKNVIYTYGKVNITEDDENDQLKVSFDYRIEEVPKKLNKKKLEKSEEFKNYIGNILTNLIEEKQYNDESTNDNTQDAN
tara:strand:- start:9774 stop:10091 length:318 start_codon:yes stop_codon:yes gene_type:complete